MNFIEELNKILFEDEGPPVSKSMFLTYQSVKNIAGHAGSVELEDLVSDLGTFRPLTGKRFRAHSWIVHDLEKLKKGGYIDFDSRYNNISIIKPVGNPDSRPIRIQVYEMLAMTRGDPNAGLKLGGMEGRYEREKIADIMDISPSTMNVYYKGFFLIAEIINALCDGLDAEEIIDKYQLYKYTKTGEQNINERPIKDAKALLADNPELCNG
jgi:hypothetical protein